MRRLLDIIEANGVVSKREKADLKTLLLSPEVTVQGRRDRELLEEVAGVFTEPAPNKTTSGADIQSAHVDASKTYRNQSLPREAMEKAGVPTSLLNVMFREEWEKLPIRGIIKRG